MSRDELAAHLEYFAELGVAGIRREPLWSARSIADADLPRRPNPDRAIEDLPPADSVGVSEDGTESDAGSAEVRAGGVGISRPDPGLLQIALSPADALAAVRADIGECTRCKLHGLGRTQIVFGVGNPEADLMFVGEAPGGDEDIQGIPFVGRAGQLLTKIIEAIGLTRDQVYIANVIKCRPPGNRNPEPDEVAQCEPFLFRQIDIIRPKVIVALGKFAAQSLLKTNDPISKLRGREYRFRDAVLMPTFHPAFLLRTPSAKREVWADMKRVREILSQG